MCIYVYTFLLFESYTWCKAVDMYVVMYYIHTYIHTYIHIFTDTHTYTPSTSTFLLTE